MKYLALFGRIALKHFHPAACDLRENPSVIPAESPTQFGRPTQQLFARGNIPDFRPVVPICGEEEITSIIKADAGYQRLIRPASGARRDLRHVPHIDVRVCTSCGEQISSPIPGKAVNAI